ncbi:MAG: DNA repair protein RadA [Clostridia bacterium]|nr:DNA repair protein RadA [Clostridia bacterium]
MAKSKTVFVCSECGYESPKWLGKCPACNSWNTFYEEKLQSTTSSGKSVKLKESTKPLKLNSVVGKEEIRTKTSVSELDRVLGGGLVKGSLILLGGEPGIGKSTLILQLCDKIADEDGKVLYISGEESAEQVKLRADRLNISNDNIMFLGETDIDAIEIEITNINPKLVVLDSIQTVYSNEITSAPGTVSQVREITARVMKCCKQNQITTVLIGHVTKDGNIAGPRVLEHMVDTVLYLEGERYFSYRILRSVKNRFGSTNEIGMFEMRSEGMCEVTNPSAVLISEDAEQVPGAGIVCSLEGTRPLLVELQALTTPSVYGIPKRTGNGVDFNKIALLIAVLEKRARLSLGNQDVYLNVVSGMKINEPAIDLGIALVIASSYKNVYIPKDTAIIGEVGLTGEIRSVNMIDKRLKESERLGIKKCIIPQNNKKLLKDKYKLDIIGVRNINEALHAIGIG